MKKLKRIAIIQNGKDIGRLIPFNPDSGTYDFKINLLNNSYNINVYKLLEHIPTIGNVVDSHDWEISYHRSKNDKPPVIHLKHKPVENPQLFFDKDHPQYINLPINRLKDPSIDSIFPIPLLKLEIPNVSLKNEYNKKKDHIIFDIEGQNVIEFYLANNDFGLSEFEHRWPCISFLYLCNPFEAFASNSILKHNQKFLNFLPENNEIRTANVTFQVCSDMQIFANVYYDKNVDKRGDKITVTFIENELADSIITNTMIAYPPLNPATNTYEHIFVRNANKGDLIRKDLIFNNNKGFSLKDYFSGHLNTLSAYEIDVLRTKYSNKDKRRLKRDFKLYKVTLLNAINNSDML